MDTNENSKDQSDFTMTNIMCLQVDEVVRVVGKCLKIIRKEKKVECINWKWNQRQRQPVIGKKMRGSKWTQYTFFQQKKQIFFCLFAFRSIFSYIFFLVPSIWQICFCFVQYPNGIAWRYTCMVCCFSCSVCAFSRSLCPYHFLLVFIYQ